MSRSARGVAVMPEGYCALEACGPLAAPGRGRRLAPFFAVIAIAVLSTPFNPQVSVASTVVILCAAATVMALMLWLPWRRYPRWWQAAAGVPPLVLIGVYVHLDGGANSPVLTLILVPLIWFALYETRRHLYFVASAATVLVFSQMMPLPPVDDVLRAVMLIAVAFVLLPAIRRLVAAQRAALALADQKSAELEHLALHDALTGLPNRALIMDRLEQAAARVRRDGGICAVLFLDLDGFKAVNDTHGHQTGDILLQAVAARLNSVIRETDTAGRLGGDEFVIVLDRSSTPQAAELLAERLLSLLRQPFTLDRPTDHETATDTATISLTVSTGVAVGDGEQGAAALLRAADIALYHAKGGGRDRYEVFRPSLDQEQWTRSELDADLRAAQEQEQFRLVYQPIYNLGDLTILGVEALIRWQHPTRGELTPDEFIPALELSGRILDVGRWVLVQACLQMQAWRAAGNHLSVAVNVSARQLATDHIIDDVVLALATSGLPANALTLEITETALLGDLDAVAERLRRLKRIGVQIALDDFGTGYSSLAYLQRFPVDTLKIDRSFIGALGRSRDSAAIIRTLVQLGHDLGVRTVAEGVETGDQLDHMRRQGVSEVQGFLLCKPLDAETLDRLVLQPLRPTTAPTAR